MEYITIGLSVAGLKRMRNLLISEIQATATGLTYEARTGLAEIRELIGVIDDIDRKLSAVEAREGESA